MVAADRDQVHVIDANQPAAVGQAVHPGQARCAAGPVEIQGRHPVQRVRLAAGRGGSGLRAIRFESVQASRRRQMDSRPPDLPPCEGLVVAIVCQRGPAGQIGDHARQRSALIECHDLPRIRPAGAAAGTAGCTKPCARKGHAQKKRRPPGRSKLPHPDAAGPARPSRRSLAYRRSSQTALSAKSVVIRKCRRMRTPTLTSAALSVRSIAAGTSRNVTPATSSAFSTTKS